MKKDILNTLIVITGLVSGMLFESCQPIREIMRIPTYKVDGKHKSSSITVDSVKKNIVIVADNAGTEIFDLMAPFYLFNATEKANVYIVADKLEPISLVKGVVIMPHFTFSKFDSLNIESDVIVLPALLKGKFGEPNHEAVEWVKGRYTSKTKVLSICVGSLVGAAAGIYDGKLLTTHASDFEKSRKLYRNPKWVKNIAVTKDGNLYSTAGVSNAVEGSLTVIDEIFGRETTLKVMNDIHYPYDSIRSTHKSVPIRLRNVPTVFRKLIFNKDRRVGLLLQNGINELEMAAVIDTYNRSFPYSNQTVLAEGSSVTSKYGLTLIPTAKMDSVKLDELHVLIPGHNSRSKATIVQYNSSVKKYMIDECLSRISVLYGRKFRNVTKIMLDYN